MRKAAFLPLLLMSFTSFSQYWVAGDTAGLEVARVEQSFEPNASVSFDIDCSHSEDFSIHSYQGSDPAYPWSRLSILKDGQVEVHNSGIGQVTVFSEGDTVFFDDSLWTPSLDFIYGTGEAGSYGIFQIDRKYIALRKAGEDTSYCFVELSTQGIEFTVHQVVSGCQDNPIGVSTGAEKIEPWPARARVFPNPFDDFLFVEGDRVKRVYLLGADGSFIAGAEGALKFFTADLPAGLYILRIFFEGNRQEAFFVIKK